MTVITKPISEKKSETLAAPLVENDQLASTVSMIFCYYHNDLALIMFIVIWILTSL